MDTKMHFTTIKQTPELILSINQQGSVNVFKFTYINNNIAMKERGRGVFTGFNVATEG